MISASTFREVSSLAMKASIRTWYAIIRSPRCGQFPKDHPAVSEDGLCLSAVHRVGERQMYGLLFAPTDKRLKSDYLAGSVLDAAACCLMNLIQTISERLVLMFIRLFRASKRQSNISSEGSPTVIQFLL
jgi:hypothetical protein